jgi:putative solute:sodium symporter small subunit
MTYSDADRQRSHWRGVRRWTLLLLMLWATASFGLTWFARDLNIWFFGWPLGYWMAGQGSMLIFLAIVALYAWVMNRLDVKYGLDEED